MEKLETSNQIWTSGKTQVMEKLETSNQIWTSGKTHSKG